MAPEGSTVKLTCSARGHPTPNIIWKRENGQNITLKSPSGAKSQGKYQHCLLNVFTLYTYATLRNLCLVPHIVRLKCNMLLVLTCSHWNVVDDI